jgi:hypothetical protein
MHNRVFEPDLVVVADHDEGSASDVGDLGGG